ncbi:MAG: adenylyltransferase/cytidyltransferase family protein [Pseudomonadota bacterium]|nr:adenylyltransferase/cytidyltransferase family protein [Pseudomonadota bacterium]
MKISVVSGGFDPIHSGHISYIKAAREHGDYLIIALNSDKWLREKKGKEFMPFNERKSVLESIRGVDKVIGFQDDDLGSCINALEKIKTEYPNDEIIFCNGGDRGKENIPEMTLKGINFKFSIGGDDKKNSSSWILKNWAYDNEKRVWGEYFNLYEDNQVKVKELIVEPGKGMSLQKHFKRSEIWLVSHGKCLINYSEESPEKVEEILLNKHNSIHINLGDWHQITNPFNETCKIIEIQYGEETIEEDIERHSYYEQK